MIENSDRGITLNKGLAWTMATGFLFGGVWLGTSITDVSRSLEALDTRVEVQRNASEAREVRLRSLEQSTTRSEERVANMISLLSRIDARLERIERAQKGDR